MKKILVILILFSFSILTVLASSKRFEINVSKLSFQTDEKSAVEKKFKQAYQLDSQKKETDSKLEKEIIDLTKKTTMLLFGEFNNTNESSESYYKRHEDYLKLRYDPEIPKDEDDFLGSDSHSQEYKDDIVSGLALPSVFNQIDNMKAVYNSFGDIKVGKINDEMVMSMIILPNVKIRTESTENPEEFETKTTNFVMYYYYKYKKSEDKYKLYNLMGETTDSLAEFNVAIEDKENSNSLSISAAYDSKLKDILDFSKLDAVTEEQVNAIYEKNKNNVIYLKATYNNIIVAEANGLIINNGLVVTSSSFLEKALNKAQHISIIAPNENQYTLNGIVTMSKENNIAVLKLNEETNYPIVLGNSNDLQSEDPIFSISSKSSVGLTTQSGIVVANDKNIQTSLLLSQTDDGSPLFNLNGEVVGLNIVNQANLAISEAINSSVLNDVYTKFQNYQFKDVEAISFEDLKKEFFYEKDNTEIISKNISKAKWNAYKKIGNISQTIKLKMLKANYSNGALSIRYKNEIPKYMSNQELTLAFRKTLEKQGYKKISNISSKYIYQNKKYQVVITEEFDYVIIVMVKR